MTDAYPLAWPAYWPRRPASERGAARFGTQKQRDYEKWPTRRQLSISEAITRLVGELDRLDGENLVVSSDVPLRRDGFPRSAARAPDDPAVAVYFTLERKPHCMPCDRWDTVADNIAAVGKHIEAMRGMARWGVGTIEAAFSGFKALPPPDASKHWTKVLCLPASATLQDVNRAYRASAKGAVDDEDLIAFNLAVEQARKEVK